MRNQFIFFLLISILTSCNLDKDRKLSEKEIKELEKAHNDSVQVIVDSLLRANIYVPPLYDKEIFDSATTVKFFDLARSTEGELKLLVNSRLITTEIIDILKSHSVDNADLLILMDKTGSMEDDISNVKKGLSQIIEVLKTFNNVRLGIALYGDKNEDGAEWFSFRNFETNYNAARDFINQIQVTAGGDYPESVYDGFFKACEQNFWKSERKRMIILIGDAPPLEKPFSRYEVTDVIAKAGEEKIKMNFYPIVVTPVSGELETKSDPVTFAKEKIISNVFPNPVSGVINISFTNNDTYAIEIFNSSGGQVLSEQFSGTIWKKDIGSFPNGAYVARVIRKDKKFETIKFILYK